MINETVIIIGEDPPIECGDFLTIGGFGLQGGGSMNRVEKTSIHFDKYFPYDNGNGQPIYNEDNGSQLRDPMTGL